MGYKRGNDVLPAAVLRAVQKHIDGEYIYIPRRQSGKRPWGSRTGIKQSLLARNKEIIAKRRAGHSVPELATEYFLSGKTIYKIISAAKRG
ncbi:MAG: hypothetical protein LIQ31_12750 [Planctomycetes bacterium]|nr:hypothetical protein [Planctomycetota bacterium]